MLMLVSGLQVVLHDSAAGSPLGVPKETILDVARSAQCLADEDWWYGPSAMQAAAWATIPGSAPEGTDPWVLLADVGEKSDTTGIRVARALQVLISVNAGRDDLAEQAIRAHMHEHGAPDILMPTEEAQLDFIDSNRRFVNPAGIFRADAIFVPLEDGDRCQALVKMGKAVVTVDLNPMSRTSKTSTGPASSTCDPALPHRPSICVSRPAPWP